MNLPVSLFELNAGGVDWDRLAELVNGSDMTYKEEVLAILRSHPEEERNDRLKALAGGRPYRSVLDVLYPQLRDACYIRVQYANRPDSVADTVNRAIEAIRGRKYEEAFRLLKTVEADERSWNVRGVCHLLCGDDKEAGLWLHRAVKAGNREAEENLKKMNAERRACFIADNLGRLFRRYGRFGRRESGRSESLYHSDHCRTEWCGGDKGLRSDGGY